MDSHFEQKKEFFKKYLSKTFQPGAMVATGTHTTLQPQGPQRGKGAPNPVESIPWLQVEGAQHLAQLQGQLQRGPAPRPTEPWLLRPAASVSPCGNAIPNPSQRFRAGADIQRHPELLSPMKKPHAHPLPLPRDSDTSCLSCISSMAISKPMARSCPGMPDPVCHWCHWCALTGESSSIHVQDLSTQGSPSSHGGNHGHLRTRQGGDKVPVPNTGL